RGRRSRQRRISDYGRPGIQPGLREGAVCTADRDKLVISVRPGERLALCNPQPVPIEGRYLVAFADWFKEPEFHQCLHVCTHLSIAAPQEGGQRHEIMLGFATAKSFN